MEGRVGFQRVCELLGSVTGWNTSLFELMKVGERSANMARVFNLREGLIPKDDVLPQRFFTPQSSGPLQGVAIEPGRFEEAKKRYCNMVDWPEGSPSQGKLEELGIEWAAPFLQ